MDWKSFLYGVLTVFVILLAMASFGLAHVGKINAINGDSLSDIPEKCRAPAGQDIDSWKEHLGHHAETRECLKYFD